MRAAFRRAAEAALADAKPSGDNAFKIELARRIVVRALALAAAGTPERMPALPGLSLLAVPGALPCLRSRLTQRSRPSPPRLEYRPAADPPRRHAEGHRRSARYAADNHPPGMLYAVMAVSQHRARPRHAPRRRGGQGASRRRRGHDAGATSRRLRRTRTPRPIRSCSGSTCCRTTEVRYANQPIAVVIAETLEAATEGAALLAPRYEIEPARVGLDAGESFVPPVVGVGNPAEVQHGDVEAGLAAAATADRGDLRDAVAVSQSRWSRMRSSPPGTATGCRSTRRARAWRWRRARVAGLFGIPPDNIHIRSPFLGGGFGSKGLIAGPQVLGIMAARLVGRPVKLVLRREQMYGPVGHRAPTRQTLRIGADGDGRADRDRSSRQDRDEHVRRFLRARRGCLAYALCQPRDRHLARSGPRRHRHAAVHARAGRGDRLDRAGERDRRDGLGLRHGSAGLSG